MEVKDDLISRQATIEMLEKQLDYLCMLNSEENPHAESNWCGVNWARNAIADMPSAESRWIPVSERLPEKNEHHVSEPCIVYCDNGAMAFSEMQENIFGQWFWECERDDDYHEPVGEVVAWMPLPDRYQEADHE